MQELRDGKSFELVGSPTPEVFIFPDVGAADDLLSFNV